MLKSIEDTLHKTCLIGLTYFTAQGESLKQSILAGTVTSVDTEMGITLTLLSSTPQEKTAQFIIPTNLSCWFNAPKGEFHTSQAGVKIIDPDYLVTWDIYQTKAEKNNENSKEKNTSQDGEQQWWKWIPRAEAPQIG